MKKLANNGFGVVEGLLIMVIVGVIGGVGFYVYNANKKTNESLDNTGNSEVAKSEKESDDNTNANTESQKYLEISEWSVNVPLNSGVIDLQYSLKNYEGLANGLGQFRTKQMNTLWPNCDTNSIGILRGKATDKYPAADVNQPTFEQMYNSLKSDNGNNGKVKPVKIGEYYFLPAHPGASCSSSPNGDPQETKLRNDVVEALNSLQKS